MSWGLLLNSLALAVPVALAAVVVGWLVALFIASSRGRVRWAALAGAIVSLALPPFLVVNAWLGLLGNVGVLKSWLPLDIYSHGGAVWVLTLMLWPLPCLMCLGAWRSAIADACRGDRFIGVAAIPGGQRVAWPTGQCRSCLLYTSPSPRDKRQSRMPSSA